MRNVKSVLSLFLSISLSIPLQSQNGELVTSLSFEDAIVRMYEKNYSIKIAEQGIETSKSQKQGMQAFWYPTIMATGAYTYLSNDIAVKQSLSGLAEPLNGLVQQFPDLAPILGPIGQQLAGTTLTFPLVDQNFATIDAELVWPVFTGGKRIHAGKIGKEMVTSAELNREITASAATSELVERYFGLRLMKSVCNIRKEAFNTISLHYEDAVKLEQNGMINKAERLFAQVSKDDALREYNGSLKDVTVTEEALKSTLAIDSMLSLNPTSPLFAKKELPTSSYFKELAQSNSYILKQIDTKKKMAEQSLKIERTGYIPEIAFLARQNIYSYNVPSNLIPRSTLGVGFKWTLFDGLNRERKIREAKITTKTVDTAKEKIETDIQVGVDKYYTQMQKALEEMNALESSLELTKELLRIREDAFKEGMATSTEVVDAQLMLSKVKVGYLQAFYQYDVALIQLLTLCGTPELFDQYRKEGITEHSILSDN
ncbi:MAG: TolC family protein [Bacteroidales bacterium]|nr:TolC family protein [Bacteroidales bacterium]